MRSERLNEGEDVAECWFDSVGDRGHADMCPPLHALRVVRGVAALLVQVQVPAGVSRRHRISTG